MGSNHSDRLEVFYIHDSKHKKKGKERAILGLGLSFATNSLSYPSVYAQQRYRNLTQH